MVFITFEGPEASGKTTQINLLADYLKSKDREVVLTKNHTGGRIAKILVEILDEDMPLVDALLFAADRGEQVEKVIKPSLKDGKIVLSDRYYHSSLALQYAQGLDFNWLKELNKFFPKPDLTIIIDVPPEISIERMKIKRDRDVEKFDKPDFLEKVRKIFLELPQKLDDKFVIINGDRSIEKIQEDIRKEVEKLL